MHSDKSAANICELRQWRSQQPSCLDYIETCSFLASYRHSLRFQPHPLLSGLCIWPWYFECERPVCPSDSPCQVNCCAHKPKSSALGQSQKLKLNGRASIHPVHFGEFSFSQTYGQTSRNHAFCRCGCLP